MTLDEYFVNKLIELERENKELKERLQRLQESNTIIFKMMDTFTPKTIYKVEFENGYAMVLKENNDE